MTAEPRWHRQGVRFRTVMAWRRARRLCLEHWLIGMLVVASALNALRLLA